MTLPAIQWYPGHIAKAERQLQEQVKKVDVVLEVRDARIPFATYHPLLATWIGNKPKLLILNRVDMIPPTVRELWTQWFISQGEQPFFANSQRGTGVVAISKAAQLAGIAINPSKPQTILAAGPGVFRSTDGGAGWSQVLRLRAGAGPVAWSPSSPRVAYVVGFDRTLYRSRDAGANWSAVR